MLFRMVFVFFVATLIPAFASADDAKTLVQGLLARDEAWTSGRFKWSYGISASTSGMNKQKPFENYSFDGESWSEGGAAYVGGTDGWKKPMRANHNGYLSAYAESPPVTDEQKRNLKPNEQIVAWKTVTLSEPVPSNYTVNNGIRAMPPTWAGAIWSRRAKNWIAEHIDDFTFVGEEVVNGIPTKSVKAPVNSLRYRMRNGGRSGTAELFEIHHKSLDKIYRKDLDKGAELRLYIAPSLGYVLPRADGVTGEGEVVQRIDQANFKKYTDTIYLPGRTERIMIGNGTTREVYELSNIHMVNESIPDEDFIVTVPAGTKVIDKRDLQRPVRFNIDEEITANANNDLTNKSDEVRSAEENDTKKTGRP